MTETNTESNNQTWRQIKSLELCLQSDCDMIGVCILPGIVSFCGAWLSAFPEKEYRLHGVKWSASEQPLLKTIPLQIENRGYVYHCQECGKPFTMKQEIHIPMCSSCRAKNIEKLRDSAGGG